MNTPAASAGGRYELGRLWSWDRSALEAHYKGLDPEDRRMRFCGAVSDAFIERHCAGIDWLNSAIIGAFAEGRLIGVAEVAIADFAWRDGAELAVSVAPDWRGRGVATALAEGGMAIARNRFATRIAIVCLAENAAMRRLSAKLGAKLLTVGIEMESAIDTGMPNPITLWQEAVLEGGSLLRPIARTPLPAH